MPKYLLVVESPAKAKTISRYLGKDFIVKASVGHVRDLPRKELGVDIERGFRPVYRLLRGKRRVIQEIKEAAGKCELVYLATDPDREGEAIAWHVSEAAKLDQQSLRRVAFHQVTKSAVQQALQSPRDLDWNLIDAQQARRVVDRLVGYTVSPLLSKSMKRALSAGRVQSVALRLIVDREREIRAFEPVEYWTIEASLRRRQGDQETFRARLHKIDGKDPDLAKRTDVDAVLSELEKALYVVHGVKKSQRKRYPRPPFITSSLQAEAANRLHFSPRQTMRIAQQLYEGIDLGGERVGLITYMRTDSTYVAPEAQREARGLIAKTWGEQYLPPRSPRYRSKVALAQEAHEAIRPTSVLRTPDSIRKYLDNSQARLYELIWRRFVASQMVPAVYDTMTVDVRADERYLFRATGRLLVFAGYLVVYSDADQEDKGTLLPALEVGEKLDLVELIPAQHFTEPPPRYSEATLIKALEKNGVGRPSTYATIVGVIQDRGYVVKEKGRLLPTDLGIVVCDALVVTFPEIMDIGYTARMETELDEIASGKLTYLAMLEAFYAPFSETVRSAEERMPTVIEQALLADVPAELLGRSCPLCGQPLAVRLSKAGKFLGCTAYPKCRYVLDIKNPSAEEEFAEGEFCEKCGGRMKIITLGRMRFLGCEHYPQCRNTRPILSQRIKQIAAETTCPECGHHPLEARKGRYGEYLHCPVCDKNFSLRKLGKTFKSVEQVDIPCPQCGHSPIEKRNGRYGPYYHCPQCKTNTSERKMAKILSPETD